MKRLSSWFYHHSAKFRNIKLGQVNRKIDKFTNKQNMLRTS